MIKHYKITVSGDVQGVFFRAHAQEAAQRLGVQGFVHNQPDGSVYIEAEGEEPALEQFLAWCRRGSPRAQVEAVSYTEHQPVGHQGFERD